MPLVAWIYIWGVLLAGAVLSVAGLPLPDQPGVVWLTWAILTGLASTA